MPCACSVPAAATIRPTSEPLAIRISSGCAVGRIGTARRRRGAGRPRRRSGCDRAWAASCRVSTSATGRSRVSIATRQATAVSLASPGRITVRFGIARSAGQLLDRLVGRAVLAERDAVVGEDVHDVQSHQRRQPDRRPHVVGEDQEGRAERHESAVRRQAVDDRAHRVLAHAEVEVAAGVAPAAAVRALRVVAADARRIEVAAVP